MTDTGLQYVPYNYACKDPYLEARKDVDEEHWRVCQLEAGHTGAHAQGTGRHYIEWQ